MPARGPGPPDPDPRPAPEPRPQVTELIQRQARALGDPTRYRIFRYVAEAPAPVRVGALVEHFGFNHNAIRQHLAKLCDARLLTEELGTSSSGRPPLQYRLAPGALGTFGAPGPYELLALLLLRLAKGEAGPQEVGTECGRELGGRHGAGRDGLDVLEAEMAQRGFDPRRERHGALVDLVLEHCPFEVAAAAEPDIVCCLHQGLAQGILEGLDADLRVTELVAYHPSRAGCRLRLAPVTPVPD